MFGIYVNGMEKNDFAGAENEKEKDLLEFICHVESDTRNAPALENSDREDRIAVSRELVLTLCSYAAMVYESQSWYQNENQLLERIYEECQNNLPAGIQTELNNWAMQKRKDALLAKRFGQKLEQRAEQGKDL